MVSPIVALTNGGHVTAILWVLDSPVGLGLLIAAGIAGGIVVWWQQHRTREAFRKLLARNPAWLRTATPCGYPTSMLVNRFAPTPRGDRRYGIRYGIEGPLQVQIAGEDVTCTASCFEWWYERRRRRRGRHGHGVTYDKQRELAIAVKLPTPAPRAVRIGPESVLGRIGLTRGGEQLESSEFNRRFRVESDDPTLTVQLLDAQLQHDLVERFSGRSIEISDDLLVIGGRPDHRDDSLAGVIGYLPAVQMDARTLLARIPDQFWRTIGADQTR